MTPEDIDISHPLRRSLVRLPKPVRITEQHWPDVTVPVVSIACTTYNHEKFVAESLEGFLIQETTFPVEIIVHDDASVDRTPFVIREYQSRHPRLFRTILQTENQWSQGRRAWPRVLQMAMGEYVALCEGDDYWTDPLKLEKQVSILERNPHYVGVFHPVKLFNECSGKMSSDWVSGPFFQQSFTVDHFLEYGNFIPTCSALSRLACSTEFQSFNSGHCFGDFVFHALNAMHGPYVVHNEVMAVYRLHPHGAYSWLPNLEKLTKQLQSLYHFAEAKGLTERRSFKNGIVNNYSKIRACHALNGNVKGTLIATWKALGYASLRLYPQLILRECKFLVLWLTRLALVRKVRPS